MKNIFLICSFLITITAFSQIDRTEMALIDEAAFDITIMVQYDNNDPYTIVLRREAQVDEIDFINQCQRNNLNTKNLLADKYEYEQLLEYLDNIDIFSYQPNTNTQDEGAKLRIQFSIIRNRTFSMNAFVIEHNPDIQGEEYQILEMISNILRDNSTDNCISDLAEKFETYVKGE
jgi:hypothetical protein